MAPEDRYSEWLRQDIPRLLLTLVAVALIVGTLWIAEQRWRFLARGLGQVLPGAPLSVQQDIPVAPTALEDSGQIEAGE